MAIDALLKTHRDEILAISATLRQQRPSVRIVARGAAGPDSDVDILVDLELSRSLLDHAQLQIDLEALLGRKVDVVSPRGFVCTSVRPGAQRRIARNGAITSPSSAGQRPASHRDPETIIPRFPGDGSLVCATSHPRRLRDRPGRGVGDG